MLPVAENAAEGAPVHYQRRALRVRASELCDLDVLKAHTKLDGGFIPRKETENSNRISVLKGRLIPASFRKLRRWSAVPFPGLERPGYYRVFLWDIVNHVIRPDRQPELTAYGSQSRPCSAYGFLQLVRVFSRLGIRTLTQRHRNCL